MAQLKLGTLIGGNTAWHSGNDGAGSGLDADLLDGQQGSYYQPALGYTPVNKAGDSMSGALSIDNGTQTASTPIISLNQTWNNAAATFTAVKLNVTNTASNANSLLIDLQVESVSKFNVNKSGVITHSGLSPTDGFEIDQIKAISKSLTLTTDWQDTGISGTDLATGTYIIQLFANDAPGGGTNSNEYYSGTMSWYSGATNSSTAMPTDEIPLHRAGGSGEGELYLRTYRTPGGVLKLQVFANVANASASNYMFKFRRMI